MSSTPVTGSAMQTGNGPCPMNRLPAEVKLELFTHCTDMESITNLQLASRSFAEVFKRSPRTIIKRTMLQLAVSEENLKLAVMVIEAAKVDSSDKAAVAAFVNQYINCREVPDSFYNTCNYASLASLMSAASSLVALRTTKEYRRLTGIRFTNEEQQQMLRSLLRVDIGRTLFRRTLYEGEIVFTSRFQKLEKKYWLSHSASELDELESSRETLSLALGRALRNTMECPDQDYCECVETFRQAEHRHVWMGFSQNVGLKVMSAWVRSRHAVMDIPFNQFVRHNESHSELRDYFNQAMGAGDTPKTITEVVAALRESLD